MPQSHIFDPSFPDIERPSCPKCGTAMWLSHIASDRLLARQAHVRVPGVRAFGRGHY